MKKYSNLLLNISVIVILTILTQVGGVIFMLTWFVSQRLKITWPGKFLTLFVALYWIFSFLIVPIVAPWFGRERIRNTDRIQPTSFMTSLLNRNYVRPELNTLLNHAVAQMENNKIEIRYLDANFPFINGFPLLPHLSHHDGKKLDISLVYQSEDGTISNLKRSRSGYGVFEGPSPSEFDQVNQCLDQGYIQYDYPKYLSMGSINEQLIFSATATKQLIHALLKEPNLQKLFIEPHLKVRLGLENEKVRYQGCRAVRHDDHIHIQVK